jgi:hypothetical protein
MRVTRQFRVQHAQILRLVETIEEQLDAARLRTDPIPTRRLFAQLGGKLLFHLTVEDGAFYPLLLRHPAFEVRHLATQYMREMGHFRAQFEDFMRQAVHSDLMRRAPERFVIEARTIFTFLRQRFHKEDNVLFEAVDQVANHTLTEMIASA